jgi:hypothetical protein
MKLFYVDDASEEVGIDSFVAFTVLALLFPPAVFADIILACLITWRKGLTPAKEAEGCRMFDFGI